MNPEDGIYQPVRFYDKPVWRDPWLSLGVLLVLAPLVVDGWLIGRLGWGNIPSSEQQTLVIDWIKSSILIFLVWSALPGSIRFFVRRRRLNETKPDSLEPGWFPDPGFKGSERYWTGTAWSDYIAQPRKINYYRNYAIIGILVVLAFLINAVRAETEVKSIDVSAAWTQSVTTYNEFSAQLPEDVNAQPWDEYAVMIQEFAPPFAESAEKLKQAVSNVDGDNVYGVEIQAFTNYETAYRAWAASLEALAAAFNTCTPTDETCLEEVYQPLREQVGKTGTDLDDQVTKIDTLIQENW